MPTPETENFRKVEISFGAIHTYSRDPSIKYVIVNLGEDDWFGAAQIIPGGRIGIVGTGTIEDIAEIVGSMSLEDIKKGMAQTLETSLPEELSRLLDESSKMPPRILTP